MADRWHSWKATAPLWGAGIILALIGISLIAAARKQARYGYR